MEASSKPSIGTSPAVQWLGCCASTTGGMGLTPDQGTKVPHAACVLVTQSCLTLCDPMDPSLPGSSVHGLLQARILEYVASPFSKGIFPTQGWNLGLLYCRHILYHLRYVLSTF